MINPGTNRLPILLYGLFQEMVRSGVPIGIRDYLEGIRALELGFGYGDRHSVCNLAQTLWARSDAERRLIARWFALIPLLPEQHVAEIERELRAVEEKAHVNQAEQKKNPVRESLAADSPGRREAESNETQATTTRVSFGGARENDGLMLPRLAVAPRIAEEYILHPQTLVSIREMAVLWRRFRQTSRHGPRTELDIDGTVRERCRTGLLIKPVYRARRCNKARLLILADVSPSMAPWLPFLATLQASLGLGLFAQAEIAYFTNLPRKQIYTSPELAEAKPLDDLLRRYAGASLLMVSDCGSVRGFLNRRRAMQTSQFLAEASRSFASVVWLNPMPRNRWLNTTAALIAVDPRAVSLPLESGQLLQVIDILRGTKS